MEIFVLLIVFVISLVKSKSINNFFAYILSMNLGNIKINQINHRL